jgi:16S rRNA U516 pseudouridylate synthase RsuA-like enzyme
MTNDGNLANELTHPSYQKRKVYLVELDKPLDNPKTLKKIERE